MTDPYLKADLAKINQRLKVYQDEILIRDKNIRDLTQTLDELRCQNRQREIEGMVSTHENEVKFMEMEDKIKQIFDEFQEKC